MDDHTGRNFAQTVRLMWIDDVIDMEGEIRRADIQRAFATSQAQASLDIRAYIDAHPGRIWYDNRTRCYRTVEGTRPLFTRGHRCAAVEIVNAVQDVRGEVA